jgi:hypothetical protein
MTTKKSQKRKNTKATRNEDAVSTPKWQNTLAEINKNPAKFPSKEWFRKIWKWGKWKIFPPFLGLFFTFIGVFTPVGNYTTNWIDDWLNVSFKKPIKYTESYDYPVDIKFSTNNNFSLVDTVINGKHGLKNFRTDEIFIQPKYENEIYFHDGYASVLREGKYGFIDTSGEEVIPCKYDYSYSSLIRKGNDIGFFNLKTKKVAFLKKKYGGIARISDSLLMAKIEEKWGLITEKGKEITPFDYDMIEPVISNSYYSFSSFSWINFVKDGKWGLLNMDGKEILSGVDAIMSTFYGYVYDLIPVKINGRLGYYDRNGNRLGNIQYDDLRYNGAVAENSGIFYAGKLNEKWEFLDKMTGKSLNETKYDEISLFSNSFVCAVKLDNKWALLNDKGNLVCDLKYDEIKDFQNGLFSARRDNKWWLLDVNGNEKRKE